MAFTRKFLASLGIDADKIDTIIEAHAGVVEDLKDEAEQYKAKAETADSLQEKVNELQKQVDTDNTDNYKSKFEQLNSDFANYKTEIENEKADAQKTDAYKALLKSAGIPDSFINRVVKSTDMSAIEIDKDGNLKDADGLVKGVQDEWGDVIPTQKETGSKTPSPQTEPLKTYTDDEISKMSADEINNNWDAIKASLNHSRSE